MLLQYSSDNKTWAEQLQHLQVPDHVTLLEDAITNHQVLKEQIDHNYSQVGKNLNHRIRFMNRQSA